jgi:hypothetical protein
MQYNGVVIIPPSYFGGPELTASVVLSRRLVKGFCVACLKPLDGTGINIVDYIFCCENIKGYESTILNLNAMLLLLFGQAVA